MGNTLDSLHQATSQLKLKKLLEKKFIIAAQLTFQLLPKLDLECISRFLFVIIVLALGDTTLFKNECWFYDLHNS